MKEKIRHDEYVKRLLEKRKQEVIKMDEINERNLSMGEGLTSPTSNLSTEETRILMEYMEQQNLFNITSKNSKLKKSLTLKKFFKMKRNQQVEVYSTCNGSFLYTTGKVAGVGRDHVMLTDLKKRYWIPYEVIQSANIPYGIPNYSNTHQHFIYDNNYREKLLYQFGETVTKREPLYQLFNEDTLYTSLNRWIGSLVEIHYGDEKVGIGKIIYVSKEKLQLSLFKSETEIALSEVYMIETLRFFQAIRKLGQIYWRS
ncbi:hypothetical protein [Bacillus pinisoli]|uniref:hypothetical protein n=1 Tax=Bacillus pinisoli TaxID=2901866 RepID=UPI001FF45DA8|nr:hypothetical protein [Bacillus pinisoli]